MVRPVVVCGSVCGLPMFCTIDPRGASLCAEYTRAVYGSAEEPSELLEFSSTPAGTLGEELILCVVGAIVWTRVEDGARSR